MSLKVKESGSNMVVYLHGRMDVHLASEIENELNDIIQKNDQNIRDLALSIYWL